MFLITFQFFTLSVILLIETGTVVSSPGVIISEETTQVLYETTAPIIYSIQVPQWDNFLSLDDDNYCGNNSVPKLCTLFEQFKLMAQEIQYSAQPPLFNAFPEETRTSTWGLKCGHLGHHFSSSYIHDSVLQKYMGFLRGCSKGVILEEDLIIDYSTLPSMTYFQNAQTIFETDFFNNFDPHIDPVTKYGIHLNFLDSLTGTGFSSFISQSLRWMNAISQCRLGIIPDSLITPSALHKTLEKLYQVATDKGWNFSISPAQEFLPFYFKNQFVDCTFSENILYVRVLVPIVKSTRRWKQITAQPIPFYLKRSEEYWYETDLPNEGTYFYEENSQRLYQSKNCNVGKPGFCKLPDIYDRSLINYPNCISDLLIGDSEKNCIGETRNTFRYMLHLPLITRESTDTYYLAGVPEQVLIIKCQEPDGSELVKEFPFPSEKGALKVNLPCFCVILTENLIELTSEAPCFVLTNQLNVTEVWHRDFNEQKG